MDAFDTCTALARSAGEPLAGTAPLAAGWFAIEVPGAWGRDGLTDTGLDPALTGPLAARAATAAVRIQLLRRPGGGRAADAGRRTVVLAHSGAHPWCEVLEADDTEIAAIDPAVCASPTPPGIGLTRSAPLVLVCTHAKRDRCCASWGRPVADTLAALHPDLVWETSHTGGHRFAANVVVLPHGLVYGGLDVADAVQTVAHHLADRVDAPHLRGRSGLERPAQAAEAFVRRELDLRTLDAIDEVELIATDPSRIRARVATSQGAVTVDLAHEPLGAPRRISCDADEDEDPAAYRLLALERPRRSPSRA